MPSELIYWNVHWEIVATLHQPTKTAFSNILFYWKDKFIKISKNEFSYVKSSKLLFKNIDKILGGTRKDISVLKLSMDVKTRKKEIIFYFQKYLNLNLMDEKICKSKKSSWDTLGYGISLVIQAKLNFYENYHGGHSA